MYFQMHLQDLYLNIAYSWGDDTFWSWNLSVGVPKCKKKQNKKQLLKEKTCFCVWGGIIMAYYCPRYLKLDTLWAALSLFVQVDIKSSKSKRSHKS